MKVIEIKEQEDGSALVSLELTESEVQAFIDYAITNLLKEHLDNLVMEDKISNEIEELAGMTEE